MDSAYETPEGADPDVFAAWGDYNADVSAGERYHTYAGYVEDQVGNYEHLIHSADAGVHPGGFDAGVQEIKDLRFWYDKLKAEYDRLFPLCGACGRVHEKDNPAQCDVAPGSRVFVELWVSAPEAGGPEDPVAFVRERVLRDCEVTHSPVLSILDVYQDDPE